MAYKRLRSILKTLFKVNMDTKMQFLFVVLLCILQCQLFEFRALEGPHHHHGLRVARAAKPQRVATIAKASTVPATTTQADAPVPTNEPVSKSTPVNAAEKTSVIPTADKATKAKQEPSPVAVKPAAKTNANAGKAIKTADDKATTPTEKPTPVNVASTKDATPETVTPTTKKNNAKQEISPVKEVKPAAVANVNSGKTIKADDVKVTTSTVKPTPAAAKCAKPETVAPTTKKNNDKAPETQEEELNEEAEPKVTSTPISYTYPTEAKTLPKTNQEAAKEAKEIPVTSSNVWHKSSAGSDIEDASTVDAIKTEDRTAKQTIPSNGTKNVKTEAVKEVACKECKAKPESMESY